MANVGKGWRLLLIGLGIAILIGLVIDFNHRMAELRRLTTEKERVSAQVTQLVETQLSLETQVVDATSEAAVYKWAYTFGHITNTEEYLVVPIQPAGSAVAPTPQPTATPQIIQNWQVWLSLLVDSSH
jgi:hypothetical protein